MQTSDLRVAIFSGNYNYVRDGANQALNRLAEYLLRQGATVRVYSPTTKTPAFEANGDLVSIPGVPIPGRSEYKVGMGLPPWVRRDLKRFRPDILHVSTPDISGHRAVTLARKWDLPVISSVHTRFETYPRYYGMAFLEPVLLALIGVLPRCDAIRAVGSMAKPAARSTDELHVGIWTRGIDGRSSIRSGRSECGLADIADDMPWSAHRRLVMEKGLDVFSDAVDRSPGDRSATRCSWSATGGARTGRKAPAAGGLRRLPGRPELGRAVASMDMLFNPRSPRPRQRHPGGMAAGLRWSRRSTGSQSCR